MGDGFEAFDRAFAELAQRPGFRAWQKKVEAIGGCEHPVYLTGRTLVRDRGSGVVLGVFDSASQPFGRLMVACGNRRASRCGPCSRRYQGDTFHLIRAGLIGGKGIPQAVARHPRVFLTLTAPSFGPVHTRVEQEGRVRACRPRRGGGVCEHGNPVSCPLRHGIDDPALGAPLCAGCFDYAGAVLWNAHAGKLWHRFTDDLRRVSLPGISGLTKKEFAAAVRVSFSKVAEYQRRGLVHFHAVVRLDGWEGPGQEPAAWATVELLEEGIRASVRRTRFGGPDGRLGELVFVWGEQVDVRPIRAAVGDRVLSDDQVAGYVAKYATKAAECVGTLDRPVTCRDCKGSGLMGACPRCGGSGLRVPLEELPIGEHARSLVAAAWELGGLREYQHLRLRAWAHQCGFGGHFSTRSRLYSVTMGELRAARADFRAAQARGHTGLPADAVVERDWGFFGSGFSEVEAQVAAQVRDHIAFSREEARWELPRIREWEAEVLEAYRDAVARDPVVPGDAA